MNRCLTLILGLPTVMATHLLGAQQGVAKPILPVAPPASTTSASTAGPLAVDNEAVPRSKDMAHYVIGPEDKLEITVWKEPGLTATVPVRPDGMITIALVGDMQAAGFTPMQLGVEIAGRLRKFIQDPSVTVTMISIHPKQVFLLGEVLHVGPVTMSDGMTPLQAISSAGGLSPFANAKKVYILRGSQGAQRKIPFDYKKAIKDGDMQGVSLIAGDTIVIP